MLLSKQIAAGLLTSVTLLAGCHTPANRPGSVAETAPPQIIANPTPTSTNNTAPDLRAPTAQDLEDVVHRIFKGSVIIENSHHPYSLVGDFNGDGSQDLAIIVKPSPGAATGMNDEFAPWIIVDPVSAAVLAAKRTPVGQLEEDHRGRQVDINQEDILLAVVHGYQSKGWRDVQATQTYLLKNAVGSKISAQDKERVSKKDSPKAPHLRGDVIAQIIAGRSGFLYYNGAKYAWYDSRTYNPGPPPRMVHDKSRGIQ